MNNQIESQAESRKINFSIIAFMVFIALSSIILIYFWQNGKNKQIISETQKSIYSLQTQINEMKYEKESFQKEKTLTKSKPESPKDSYINS